MPGIPKDLTAEYGAGFFEKGLRHMRKFAEIYLDEQIVVSVMRQLSWTYLIPSDEILILKCVFWSKVKSVPYLMVK